MLNFFGVINTLGYGVFTYNLMAAYDRWVSQDIAFFPTPFGPEAQGDLTKRWLANGIKFKKTDPSILFFQVPWMNQFSGSPMIGFPIFELDRFTPYEVQMLKALDAVFQPSAWGKKVVESHGIQNVHVVPGGFDPDIYRPGLSTQQKLDRIQKQGISFIHVGKFEPRKSSAEILQCFCQATEGHSGKVTFCYHVPNPFDVDWYNKVQKILLVNGFTLTGQQFVRGQTTVVVPRERFQTDVRKLYHLADFGIWASKAEGWNLPLLECLASGVPCLTMDNTAQSEFIKRGVYPAELILTTQQKEPTHLEASWWNLDQVELRDRMGKMLKDPESYLKLESACLESVKDFTWENSARKLGSVLGQLKN